MGGWLPEVCALPLDRDEVEVGGGDEEVLAPGKSRVRHMLFWVWVQMLLVLRVAWSGVAGTSQDTSGEKPI